MDLHGGAVASGCRLQSPAPAFAPAWRRDRMVWTSARLLCVIALVLLASAAHLASNAATASDHEPTISTPRPARWMPSGGTGCRTVRRKGKVCDGPRRTPEPYGSDAV